MPHGFEYIVRPYQSPDSLGASIIPATPKGTRERAQITWGGKGTMPILRFVGVDFNTKKSQSNVILNEQDRVSQIIRIAQEGKPENYVDVARAQNVRLGREETITEPKTIDQRAYTETVVDTRLAAYTPDMAAPSTVTDLRTGRETWNMRNE